MTVIVPDMVLICENLLMAEGYVDAKSLASKFYGLYNLLRELLSKQQVPADCCGRCTPARTHPPFGSRSTTTGVSER
jgi:hypothetical protein